MSSVRDTHARSFEVVASQRDFAIARWSRVNLMFWRRQVTVDGLLAAEENHNLIAQAHGKVIGLSMIGDVLALPDTAARHHAARFMQSSARTQLCSVVIIEGEGFLNMTARGLARALQLLSRVRYPFEVLASSREAAPWCAQQFAAPAGWADELVAVIAAGKRELLSPQGRFMVSTDEPDPHDRPTRP